MSGVPPDYVMPDYRMTVRFVTGFWTVTLPVVATFAIFLHVGISDEDIEGTGLDRCY
jgi:hypothetical protein